jgi:hypothetical protein
MRFFPARGEEIGEFTRYKTRLFVSIITSGMAQGAV